MRKAIVSSILVCVWTLGCSSSVNPDCSADEDCQAGFHCRNSECVYDCTRDSECPEGFTCTVRGKCERGCVKTHGGQEVCDGIDNDCDDETDEGFDRLGTACDNQGCPGEWICSGDGISEVCNAPAPAAADTLCDGLDEDCDGQTDEEVEPASCALQAGVCTGTVQICQAGGVWGDCDYGLDYTEGIDDRCDLLDNDCDGETDEDASPLVEGEFGTAATDGIDNNCNGLADEPGGAMVQLRDYPGVWIDAFEAAVFAGPDCTGTQYGVAADDYPAGWPPDGAMTVDLYACSLPGVMPSGYLSWHRARSACEAQDKRLCRDEEWGEGCTEGESRFYPYPGVYSPGVCNDGWTGTGVLQPTGAMPECTALGGTWDMSGNLAEWLQHWDPIRPGNALTAGFHYVCELCEAGLDCFPCDPEDEGHYDDVTGALNCQASESDEESFLRDDARSYLGTRCCYEP